MEYYTNIYVSSENYIRGHWCDQVFCCKNSIFGDVYGMTTDIHGGGITENFMSEYGATVHNYSDNAQINHSKAFAVSWVISASPQVILSHITSNITFLISASNSVRKFQTSSLTCLVLLYMWFYMTLYFGLIPSLTVLKWTWYNLCIWVLLWGHPWHHPVFALHMMGTYLLILFKRYFLIAKGKLGHQLRFKYNYPIVMYFIAKFILDIKGVSYS